MSEMTTRDGTTGETAPAAAWRATLDDLFRHAVAARPDELALLDPPDRDVFTDGPPRRLTWAQADRVVSAIANLLKSFGLSADALVAVQLPNIVEGALVLLGVLRAGLIAAPLPLLWRQADACAALSRIGARALITCRRVGDVDHAELSMHVAAETFAIRFVCAFGRDLPDGIIPLDDLFDEALPASPPAIEPNGHPAERIAVVTFDTTADGLLPVARTHSELIAAGQAVADEIGLAVDTRLLGGLMMSSLAGLGSTLVPWLLSGATLWLHQPFTPAVFAAQPTDVAILPGPLLPRLIDAGLIGCPGGLKTIVAVWRAPERLATAPAWTPGETMLVDTPVFGEIGFLTSRRGADGKPAPFVMTPGPSLPIELARSPAGTLVLRGAMVPHRVFPPGGGQAPRLTIREDGFVDTGYPCRVDRDNGTLVLDGPPAGIVSVGGYRFAQRELDNLVKPLDGEGSVAALPDAIAGHRLAGIGGDLSGIREKLTDAGAHALVTAAFQDKRSGRASTA
jgi:non-ribosomal peptide synthetase component E (peptide arylation enzyme)